MNNIQKINRDSYTTKKFDKLEIPIFTVGNMTVSDMRSAFYAGVIVGIDITIVGVVLVIIVILSTL